MIDDYLGDRGQHNNMILAPRNNCSLSFTDERSNKQPAKTGMGGGLLMTNFFLGFLVFWGGVGVGGGRHGGKRREGRTKCLFSHSS